MPEINEWEFGKSGEPPSDGVGWYAVLLCWDAEEGSFPDANHWNGAKWEVDDPVSSVSLRKFDTKKDAYDWAYAHDPDGA